MNAADLQAFCSDADDIRHFLCKPWSAGEYTYASNGHIIIRVARLPDVPEEPKAPDAAKMIAGTAPASNWMPVPEATMPPKVECPECGGTGVQEFDTQHDTITEDCEWCNKTGQVKAMIGVQVGDTWFDQGYLSMLQGWEISPDGQNAAWIRRDDADGLLMPRRRP